MFPSQTVSTERNPPKTRARGPPHATPSERLSMPLIELKHLRKSFGFQRVLNDVNLSVERGQSLVILGVSGSGKSVILKHMVGLLKPDRGEVFFDGKRIDNLP